MSSRVKSDSRYDSTSPKTQPRLHTISISLASSRDFSRTDSANDVAVSSLSSTLAEVPGLELKFLEGNKRVTITGQSEGLVSEGDGVFVLGFPMGMAGEERNAPIVRQGCIARIRDWQNGKSNTVLVDAFVFPGNSGGPVVVKPDAFAIGELKPNTSALLLGMVSSYVPYRDVAVSEQTGNVRVIFEENSGLVNIVPADTIHQTVERLRARLGESTA